MRTWNFLGTAALLAVACTGCQTNDAHADHMHGDPHAAAHANMWATVNRAVAVIYPTKGNQVSGTLTFDKVPAGVHIHGQISGLEPKSTHAMHIHEFGDASAPDGTSAGSHFNPEGHTHGGPSSAPHHAGDLGNITADDAGKATIDMTVNDLSIAELRNPVIGRGVVIHAKADDFQTQPTGNAGGRIGVGVIGIAKNP